MIITAYHALVLFLRYRKLHKYVVIRKQRAPLLIRKNISDKLEQLKPIVTRIGFLIAISSTILAFNWVDKDEPVVEDDHVYTLNDDFEIEPEATVQKKKTQPKVDIVIKPDALDSIMPDTSSPDKPFMGDSIFLPPDIVDTISNIFDIWDLHDMPEFPGGDSALFAYLVKSYKYPKQALDMRIEGGVYVEFIINKSGKAVEARIVKGLCVPCDKEALRVINKMPRWKPGRQGGKPVFVRYYAPFKLKINRF